MQKLTQKEFENLYTTKTQLHDYDLSSIQISPETLTGFVTYQSQDFVKGWTDNIIQPLEIRMETCYFQITLYLMSAFAGLPVPHGRALVRKFSLVIATFSVPRVIEPPEMTFGDSTERT